MIVEMDMYQVIKAECYHNNNFDNLYPLLADNVKYFTQRTYDDTVWKNWVMKIYKEREKDFEWVFCETQIVELQWNMNKDSKIIWRNNIWEWRVLSSGRRERYTCMAGFYFWLHSIPFRWFLSR